MTLKAKNDGGVFTPAPAGNHVAICYGVIDLGTQHQDAFTYEGKSVAARDVQQILVMWELPNEEVTFTDSDGVEQTKPAVISKFYTNSLYEQAALRQHLEAWRGRDFTEDELMGFDVGKIVGKPCMVNVIHKNNKAKVTGVAALPKGVSVAKPTNDLVQFDLDNFDAVVFNSISEGIQKIIMRSAEWDQNNFLAGNTTDSENKYSEDDDFQDDDIPF